METNILEINNKTIKNKELMTELIERCQLFVELQPHRKNADVSELLEIFFSLYTQTFNEHIKTIKETQGSVAMDKLIKDHMCNIRKFINQVSNDYRKKNGQPTI